MKKLSVRLFAFAAMICGIFFLTNCGSSTTTTTTTNTTTKTETASTDSIGVPECDEYIKKYEACLTKIAAKAPQVQDTLQTSFKAQRDGFKQAAANPASKTQLASTCKQAIDTAKQSTAPYACEW